jgi:hypothetical protein
MVTNGVEPAVSVFRVKSEGNMLLRNVVTSVSNVPEAFESFE